MYQVSASAETEQRAEQGGVVGTYGNCLGGISSEYFLLLCAIGSLQGSHAKFGGHQL